MVSSWQKTRLKCAQNLACKIADEKALCFTSSYSETWRSSGGGGIKILSKELLRFKPRIFEKSKRTFQGCEHPNFMYFR